MPAALAQIPSFIFGGNAPAKTPQEAARNRAVYEQIASRLGTAPQNVGQGLSAVGQAFLGRAMMDRANAGEEAGRASAAKLAAGLADGADMSELQGVLADPWAMESPGTSLVAQTLLKRNMDQSDPMWQLDRDYKTAQIDALKAKPVGPEQFDVLSPEEVTQLGLPPGSYQRGSLSGKVDPIGTGGTNVTVNTGEGSDSALDKKLSEKEGELWSTYKQAGTVSASNAQDFGVLDELVTLAPQGPITGRLAEAFKGFSSSADAFQSIVKRIAPTLRAPGSGATSDIEYQGMLDSLPSLANQPAANTMILSIMKAKADINMKRSEIITAYQAGDLNIGEARKALNELDRVSILTPEMRDAIKGLKPAAQGDDAGTPPEGINQDDWNFMTPEERALWN